MQLLVRFLNSKRNVIKQLNYKNGIRNKYKCISTPKLQTEQNVRKKRQFRILRPINIFHKLWYFLRTYVLMLKTFDLFLQGSFLIVILLESNVFLLLRRDANEGYHSALVEDYVMLGAAGAEFVLGAAVAWWGRGRRQLALSGWLAATSAAGLMVLAFPFSKSNPASVELCGEQTVINIASDNNVAARTAFLVITAVLCGLTKLSIWAHGLTYLDDHDPQNGPYFYGILISIRLSLGLSGSNWLRPSSEREEWWEAHLSVCMLTFMFAFLFILFPTRMSSCKGLEGERDSDVDTGLLPSLGRLVRNKALVTQTLALSCLSTAVLVYVYYDRAYVQARYRVESIRQDPRTSRALSDIFRALVIIFFVMIFRVRFSARRPEGVKSNTASRVAGVIAVFVAIFFVVMASVGCDTGNINGLQSGSYHQPSCSNTCGCNSERYGYSPVCALDTGITYFSPCHAGCSSYEDLNGFQLFHECACATGSQRAVRGSCTLSSCMLAYSVYQVVYTVMLAVSASSFLMQGMAVIRAVRPGDKVTAVGSSLAVVALLSFVLGHLIYMLISHLTCAHSANGACLLHAPTLWAACAASALLAAMAAAGSLVASRMPTETKELTTEL